MLAVRTLSAGQPHLVTAMDEYLAGLESEVLGKVDKIEQLGWEDYLEKRKAGSI